MELNPDLTHPQVDIEANWVKLEAAFKTIPKDGILDLWKFISEKTDFKTAPASAKYHLNCKGGLAEHTLNVLKFTLSAQEELLAPDITVDNIHTAALIHDLCKVNYYVEGEEWDKEWKDTTNQWRKKKVWKIDDKIPLGHGEKSVIMANRFIPLTMSEMAAIRWHMAWSDQGVHSFYPSGAPFKESLDRYPLLKLLMLGDTKAEFYETYHYEPAKK